MLQLVRGNSHPARRYRKMDAREVGRPHNRLMRANVGIPNVLDARVDPQWDYFSVAKNTATVSVRMFTIPQGQQYTPTGGTALTKNQWHTSLQGQGGVFPAPIKLLVKDISFICDPNIVPTDLNNSILNYYIRFDVMNKEFWQGHMQKLPGGGGAFFSANQLVGGGTALTGPSQSFFSSANGWPTAENYSPLCADAPGASDAQGNPLPPITGVLIESGQPFVVIADPTLAGAGTGFTTTNLSVLGQGYLSPGITWFCYLEGITLVAVV